MSTKKCETMFLLGERLKEERHRLKKTQDELSNDLGVTVRTFGKYERDETIPDALTLSRMYKIGIDIFYLLTGNRTPIYNMSELEEEMLISYRKTVPEIKSAITKILDAYKS